MLILLGVLVLCIAAYYLFRGGYLILHSLLHKKRWDEELKEWLGRNQKRLEKEQ